MMFKASVRLRIIVDGEEVEQDLHSQDNHLFLVDTRVVSLSM
jgi:hypothetical protein